MPTPSTSRAQKQAVYRLLAQAQEPTLYDVEYNMDSTDQAIYQLLAETHPWISEDDYELVMDRLEKEFHFLQRIAATKIEEEDDPPEECNVCGEQETGNENFLVLCDGCNIAVHQQCYGIPNIPDGNWLCRRCLLSPKKKVSCELCQEPGGAFKKTNAGGWCHVLCGMLVPGARFENSSFLEPIDTEDVPRHATPCLLCGSKRGGAAQCGYGGCRRNFHATCAIKKEYYVDLANSLIYCSEHNPCRKINSSLFLAEAPDIRYPVLEQAPMVRKNVELWIPQRRVQNSIEGIVPKILHYTVNRIVYRDLHGRPGATAFVKEMHAAWQVRRRGESIIRGLRIDAQPPGFERWGAFTPPLDLGSKTNLSVLRHFPLPEQLVFPNKELRLYQLLMIAASKVAKCRGAIATMVAQLGEEMRAGEHQQSELISAYIPEYREMLRFLERLNQTDTHHLFRDPVTEEIAPNYSAIIASPQCLEVIEERVQQLQYTTLAQLCADVELLISNAYAYNGRESLIGKEAAKLERVLGQWQTPQLGYVLARIPPNPYLPYQMLPRTANTPSDCVRVKSVNGRGEHTVERAGIHPLPKSRTQTQALLHRLNRITGISIEQHKTQTQLIKKVF